jgi:hypothetical protein
VERRAPVSGGGGGALPTGGAPFVSIILFCC